ncbi:BPI fold-containing family C [Pelobates cultripes]|uniref:Bactericidal permeability-increasing protein n=1 Tax=Pelobates cultripes TaxID=61616 RepID=A0AAD1SNV5_PELCU|nr:BPI fold-containing family C [Pelobates cultripes]
MMQYFGSITSIFLVLLSLCSADNPGLKVKVTKKGLDKGVEYGMHSLISQLKVTAIPAINGSVTMGEDSMNYGFKDTRIVDFKYSSISSTFVPGTGIQITIQGGSATLTSNWEVTGWLITDSGTSVLTLSEMTVTFIFGMRLTKSSKPSIYTVSCQSDIIGVNLTMEGGVDYIYDAVKKPMKKMIRKDINQQLCSLLRGQMQRWDESLSNLNLNVSIDNLIGVDMSLINNPVFTEQFAEVDSKAMFYSSVNKTNTVVRSSAMSLDCQADSMLCAGISEASLNSVSLAYYSGGGFFFHLSRLLDFHGKTKSKISGLLAELSQHFSKPKKEFVSLSASKAPTVILLPNNVTVGFSGYLNAYVLLPKSKRENLFTAHMDISVSAKLSLSDSNHKSGQNLTGSVSLNRFELKLEQIESEYKNRKEEIKKIVEEDLITLINEKLKVGWNIPFHLVNNTSSEIKQGFLVLNSDLIFESVKNIF